MGTSGSRILCAELEKEKEIFCFWQDLFFSPKRIEHSLYAILFDNMAMISR
jgi:hypothetical protein